MARFLRRAGFTSMGIIATVDTTVILTVGTFWVCWSQWQSIELRLNVVHHHSYLWKLCPDRWFGADKECIGLCQYFQLVTLRLHSLDDSILIFYNLVMILWRGWRYTVYVLYCCCVSPFDCSSDHYHLFTVGSVKNVLNVAHVLRLVVCRLHSLISSLKVEVYVKRVIPLENIIASEIVWPPARTNSLPFSNYSISHARGSAGS